MEATSSAGEISTETARAEAEIPAEAELVEGKN